MKRYCLFFVCSQVAAACGSGGAKQHPDAVSATAFSFSTHQLHEAYAAISQNQRDAYAASVSGLGIKAYYQLALKTAGGASFSISDWRFPAPVAALKQRAAAYEALAASFPTMGAYWQAVGFDPHATLSEDALTEAVMAASQEIAEAPQAHLSLVKNPSLLTPPPIGCSVYDPPFTQFKIDVKADRHALPAGALGIGLAPNADAAGNAIPNPGDGPLTMVVEPVPNQARDWLNAFNAGLFGADTDFSTAMTSGGKINYTSDGSSYQKFPTEDGNITCRYRQYGGLQANPEPNVDPNSEVKFDPGSGKVLATRTW